MSKQLQYTVGIKWTGNNGTGTSDYTAYERSHVISTEGKVDIQASSDIPFRGDNSKHNPEDMFISALSSCHMLWYLHLCADAGIVVVDYEDKATGIMTVFPSSGGHFTEVTLHPVVTITDATMIDKANELHKKAGAHCFIANSCNFPIGHEPICKAVVAEMNERVADAV